MVHLNFLPNDDLAHTANSLSNRPQIATSKGPFVNISHTRTLAKISS